MELIDEPDRIVIAFTSDEFALIAGSVNEAIEAVDDWEFSTRLGVEKDFARWVRSELAGIAARIRRMD